MSTVKKIFVASSMLDPFRDEIPEIINRINQQSRTLQFELVMFENTAFPLRNIDNQQELDRLAAECDIFLFLIERDGEVGQFTMGEYKSALDACRSSDMRRPIIVPYVIYSGAKVARKIPYQEIVDGVLVQGDSIEERIYTDLGGKRYSRFVPGDNTPGWGVGNNDFLTTLERDLKETISDSFYYYRQDELSYAYHISNSTQSIRKSDTQYFKRDEMDGAMADIIGRSSLLILEGNSFSGKTRAVYELMKNNPQWSNADFYIYNCGYDTHTVATINQISTYRAENAPHAVFFIDDFSKILDRGDIEGNAQFWQLMRSITPRQLPAWNKITIIITMSGELTYHEKHNCYRKIFGNEIYQACFNNTLHDVIVNFDIYDRCSFRKLAGEMVRAGIIGKDAVRPGNYTIGSLFVDMNRIKEELQPLFSCDRVLQDVAQLIKMQLMYCNRTRKGLYEDIRNMWYYKTNCASENELVAALERLCSMRWIVLDYEESHIVRIHIDNYVVEAITLPHDFVNFLIYYAYSGRDVDVKFPERMAYILCDRMCLLPGEVTALIGRFGQGEYIAQSLYKICNKYKKDYPDSKWQDQYANVFCQNAITSLPYNESKEVLDKILSVIKHEKTPHDVKEQLEELYIKSVYRLLSNKKQLTTSSFREGVNILPLTMAQEKEVLARIFKTSDYRIDDMKSPFSADDFKDVFNLRRIMRFVDKSPKELVSMAENSLAHSAALYIQAPSEDDYWGDEDTVEDDKLNNIFIPQVCWLLIETLQKTASFDEWTEVVNLLKNSSEQYIQAAVSLPIFSTSIYKNIRRLASRYSYDDRYKLFNYLIDLPDDRSILNVAYAHIDIAMNHNSRVAALNKMLELLDEVSVIQAYDAMMNSGNHDGYTLSMYMKNEFLMFEHLLDAVIRHGGSNNLTNNQLLYKAKTISDAQMCLRNVMNIQDGDAASLPDEFALGAYIGIERLPVADAIDIVKRWKNRHPGKPISDMTVGTMMSKFAKVNSITHGELALLFGIPDPDDRLATEEELYDRWGLNEKEINSLRINPQCWNQFLQKLNRTNDMPLMECAFEKLVSNGIAVLGQSNPDGTPCYHSTSDLVFDETYKTYILSEYIKNVYDTYDETRQFIDNLRNIHPQLSMTVYLYKQFLRKIVNDFLKVRDNANEYEKARREAIDKVNSLLIVAYNNFAHVNTRQEVVDNMSILYAFRVQLVTPCDFYQEMPYAYEDSLLNITFSEYLDYIYNNETAYADGNFIFMALCTMNGGVDDAIYNKIKAIAGKIHRGVDMEKKSNKERLQLSQLVTQRLVQVGEDDIVVDKDLVYNYSPIKMLMYITTQERKCYKQMERYRLNMNIPVTSTYLNYAFDVIARDRNKNSYEKYILMKNLLNQYCGDDSLLSKTIQMFIRMLGVCQSERQLCDVIDKFPAEFCETSEFIGVWSRRYFDIGFRNDPDRALAGVRQRIIDNRCLVNIHIVNGYLNAMYRMVTQRNPYQVKKAHRDIMLQCWLHLQLTGSINLNTLLQLPDTTPWEIQANQLSYIYFARVCRENIVTYIADKFNNDFHYEHNKSCLIDCLKNFAEHQYDDKTDLSRIVDILTSNPLYKRDIDTIYDAANRGQGKWGDLCRTLKMLLNACSVVKKS